MNDKFVEPWQIKSLEEVSTFRRGSFPQPYGNPEWFDDNGYPFVQVYDINQNNKLNSRTKSRISAKASKKSVFIEKGSLIVSIQGSIGRVAITQYDAFVDRTILIFNDFEKHLDKGFFLLIIKELFLRQGEIADGGVIKTITKQTLKNFKIKIPPLSEQKKIAEIFSGIDKLIGEYEIKLKKLLDLKQSSVNQLLINGIINFNFKDTQIGRIPSNWDIKCLRDICKIKHGFAFDGEFFTNKPNPYILLTPGNFNVDGSLYFGPKTKYYTGKIPDEYVLKNGDLLVVMTDLTSQMAILGNAVILESRNINLHNQRIGKVTDISSCVNTEFLCLVLNSSYVKNYVKLTATGTTVRHTSPSKILDNSIPLPPLNEQKKIVSMVNAINECIKSSSQKITQTKLIKNALNNDLLSGIKRVNI